MGDNFQCGSQRAHQEQLQMQTDRQRYAYTFECFYFHQIKTIRKGMNIHFAYVCLAAIACSKSTTGKKYDCVIEVETQKYAIGYDNFSRARDFCRVIELKQFNVVRRKQY